MAKFKYVARDAEGARQVGTLESEGKEDAITEIRRRGLIPLQVMPDRSISLDGLFGSGKKAPAPRVSKSDIVVFTRQFSTMVSAGIPVLECLDILRSQAEDPGFEAVLATIIDDVRSGADLSEALTSHPKVFERIYVNMVAAGEASGQLDTILDRLAGFLEDAEKLKRAIKSAMTYPVISLTMILGITLFLMVFIIPKFKDIFVSLGIDLPLPTVVVLGASDFIIHNVLYVIVGVFIFFFAVKFYIKTPAGNYQKDLIILKMPIFGDLAQKVAISRFARTFSTLIRSGVPIMGALEIVSQTAGNAVLERAIDHCRDAIRQGESISKPLAETPIFPPMVVRMIETGEKSGALETLLEKISEFYDDQVEATVEALTSLIEPLMIGVMGAVVGGIVLAVFLPIFKMQEALQS